MKTYSKFIELTNNFKIQDFPSELVNEGLIRSFDYDIFVDKLNKLFKKYGKTKSVTIDQNHQGVLITFENHTFNKHLLTEFLSLLNVCGYVMSYYYYEYFNFDKVTIGKPGENAIFNKKYDLMMINIIKKYDIENYKGLPEYLYHVTERKNIEKILKKGLIPKAKNKIEEHPERIYFTDNIDGANDFRTMLQYSMNFNIEDLIILKINTKLLNKIKLYYDPTFFETEDEYENNSYKAFYTYDNISPYSIEII